MLAAGHTGLADLEMGAAVESVQHSAPEQTGKAKGLNPFMAAKLADAIGKSRTRLFSIMFLSCFFCLGASLSVSAAVHAAACWLLPLLLAAVQQS